MCLGIGAAYATAKVGVASTQLSIMRPDLFMRCIVPILMAGVVALYGLIAMGIMVKDFKRANYPLFLGAMHLGSGLAVGFGSLAAGFAMGVCGEAGLRGFAQQPRLYASMIIVLIFAEVLGLYGIVACIMMCTHGATDVEC